MEEQYIQILEKTNQQLSLWTNPYGIMVGILTLVVAVMAVVVAWYIWKNSKEQKDLFREVIEKHQKTLDVQAGTFIEQKKKEINKTIKDFEKLKNSVTEEKKSEFEKVIDEYRKVKEKIYDIPVSIHYDDKFDFGKISNINLYEKEDIKSTHCTNCGTFFKYKENTSDTLASTIFAKKKVYCPKCNTENFIN